MSARSGGEVVPSGGTPGKTPLGDPGGWKPPGRTGVSRRRKDRVSSEGVDVGVRPAARPEPVAQARGAKANDSGRETGPL